jgi:hypothetical protein
MKSLLLGTGVLLPALGKAVQITHQVATTRRHNTLRGVLCYF